MLLLLDLFPNLCGTYFMKLYHSPLGNTNLKNDNTNNESLKVDIQ